MHSRFLALPLVLAFGAAACGGGAPAPEPTSQEQPAAAPAAAAVDPATVASISGTVAFEGTAPTNQPIKMNADPVCMKENPTPQVQETYMVKDGKLGNVFVFVQDGLGGRTFTAPTTPVVLDQKGCRYHPHVFGLMVGQPMEIVNSDSTLHNIHAIPGTNQEFNTAQPIKGMKTDHVFSAKEEKVVVPFKCDVHGWMNAYAGVLDHPYFAVTGEDGKFTIKDLPPGTYTLAAWHEKGGTKTISVTVAAKEAKEDANFTFDAAGAGN
jgi:plastocyanin